MGNRLMRENKIVKLTSKPKGKIKSIMNQIQKKMASADSAEDKEKSINNSREIKTSKIIKDKIKISPKYRQTKKILMPKINKKKK